MREVFVGGKLVARKGVSEVNSAAIALPADLFNSIQLSLKITPDVFQRIEEIASVIDPIYFVGDILPRPLIITVGKHDELIRMKGEYYELVKNQLELGN